MTSTKQPGKLSLARRARSLARDPGTSAEELRGLRDEADLSIDRLLARHPNAPEDLLEALSHSPDRATRRQVCLNATSPRSALLRLAPQFPRDFIRNPIVDWLLIEEPDLLQNIGKGVLRNVLKHSSCPAPLIGWAARHGSVEHQLAVTTNPSAEADVLSLLARRKGAVARAARGHMNCPERLRAKTSGAVNFVQAIRDALEALSASQALSLWRRGLLNPAQWCSLSPASRAAVLGLEYPLAQRRKPDNRGCRAFAKSPDTPQAILAQLATHPDWRVRFAVAQHPNPPEAVTARLAKDRESWVARSVAENPATPASVLERLSRHSDWFVRSEVARNPGTAPSVLMALAGNAKRDVLEYVAQNWNAPAGLLESFARDPDPSLRSAVAKNPCTPSGLLSLLASDPEEWVRQEVAKNQGVPVELLESFARDPNPLLRRAVALNPRTPSGLLSLLASDPRPFVSVAADHRTRFRDGDTFQKGRRDRTSGAITNRRLELAFNPGTSPEVLTRLANVRSMSVRWAVAANANTPPDLRRKLVIELAVALGFDGLPRNAREIGKEVRERVLLINDARHWWHKLQLACKRYRHRALPNRLTDDELVKRFNQEVRVFASDPQSTLAASIMGTDRYPFLYVPSGLVEKALRIPLYDPYAPDITRMVGVTRLFALSHSNAPVEWLIKSYRSIDWLERMAIARNLGLPARLLSALTKDANRFVAEQAAATESLQKVLGQWPDWARAIGDPWRMLQLGVTDGIVYWDGFAGETQTIVDQVRRHGRQILALVSGTQSVEEFS